MSRRDLPGTMASSYGGPRIRSEIFSAIMSTGAFRFPAMTCGMIEASAIRSRGTALTRPSPSTTVLLGQFGCRYRMHRVRA
jgi:hypothetical protein